MSKVVINGFGRIGRLVFRLLINDPSFEIVGINDLSDPESLAYLLKYDSAHRNFMVNDITHDEKNIIVNGQKIPVFAESDALNCPWRSLNVDLVYECSGFYTSAEKADKHIQAGAKKVIISAPSGDEVKTIVYSVNEKELDGSEKIISTASCTTNCLAPVIKVLHDVYGVKKGLMATIHAYTNDQSTLDVAHKKGIKSRRGRAAAANIVPTSTGAAKAIGLVIKDLAGKLDGVAYRVPTITGSVVDLTVELGREVTKEEINNLLKSKQTTSMLVSDDPLVSSDVIGSFYGAVVDSLSTSVLNTENGQLVKIVMWYDNEMGYTAQMIRTSKYWLRVSDLS